jgi:hypothetical protein
MLHKDYDRKGSVARKKNSGRESQGDWRQDELIGGKLELAASQMPSSEDVSVEAQEPASNDR